MRRDVVVIGASAGGVDAICRLLRLLSPTFPAAIAITLHRGSMPLNGPRDGLADVFDAIGALPCVAPLDGQTFAQGASYLAPPDLHMVFSGVEIRLERGPKEHHTRPAIDPMFRSAATTYGPRVIGILLTGNLSDGVHGMCEIQQRGGVTLAQDPREAGFPSMPREAIRANCVDRVLSISSLAAALEHLVLPGSAA